VKHDRSSTGAEDVEGMRPTEFLGRAKEKRTSRKGLLLRSLVCNYIL